MKEMERGLISCELRSEFIRDHLKSLMGDAPAIVTTCLATGLNKDQS